MQLQYILFIAPCIKKRLLPKISKVGQVCFKVYFGNLGKDVAYSGVGEEPAVKGTHQQQKVVAGFYIMHTYKKAARWGSFGIL